jgi:hypothetical protein
MGRRVGDPTKHLRAGATDVGCAMVESALARNGLSEYQPAI